MRKITTLFALLLMAVIGASAANVAKIGTTEYATFEAAWNAVQDGETITLLADCNGNGLKTSAEGKFTEGIIVDFAGHTYTVDGDLVGSTGTETQAFQLLKNNTITFKDGTIYSEKALFLVQNYSNLTLKNMTLTLNNPDYTSAYTLSNNNGNTTIDNTTINANPAGGVAFDVCRYASYPSVSVTVTGDSYINGDIEVSASGSSAGDGMTLNLQSGTLNGDLDIQASAQTAIANSPGNTHINTTADIAANDNFDQTHHVAKIGDQGYETFEAAWNAAQANAANGPQTITLLKNSAGNGLGAEQGKFSAANALTVDFAGYTYTIDGSLVGSTGTVSQAFQLLKDNTITFKNGTIYSEKARMLVQNYSNLTLENMTLTLNNSTYAYPAYTLSNNNGDVVIDNTTINVNTAPAGGFAFDVCRYASYPSVNVTVTGNSVINGDVELSAGSSDPKDGFSLTIEDGTFNGEIVVDPTAETAMAADEDSKISISGGSFSQIVPAEFCAEGFVPVTTLDENGMYTVGQGKVIEDGVAYNNATMGTGNDEVNLVYTRTFTEDMVGKYQCFMVPFSIIESEIPEGVTLYGIYGGATGVEAGNTVAITEIRTYDCNLPAVIKVDRAGTYNFFVNSNIIGDPYSLPVEADNYNITVTGTYDFTTANALNEWASLNTDGQLIWSYKGDTVKPYRWILKATDKATGLSAPVRDLKFVEVDNAGIDTGISTINAVSSESEIEAIYSANGQRLQSMQKGINIIRMKDNTVKKVIIK